MAENPFRILGLNPNAFKGIRTYDQARKVAEAVRKVRQRLHHPDIGGDPRVFKEVTAAWEQISSSQEEFEFWRQKLLRSKRDSAQEEISALNEQIRYDNQAILELKDVFIRFFRASSARSNTLSAFNLRPVRFLISDLLVRKILSPPVEKTGALYYELETREDGKLKKIPLSWNQFKPGVGTPVTKGLELRDGQWTYVTFAHGRPSFYLKQRGECELSGIRLLGAIEERDYQRAHDLFEKLFLEGMWDAANKYKPPALPYGTTIEELTKNITDGYSFDKLIPFLRYMTPNISKNNILIGINYSDSSNPRFYILGSVLRIQYLDQPKNIST